MDQQPQPNITATPPTSPDSPHSATHLTPTPTPPIPEKSEKPEKSKNPQLVLMVLLLIIVAAVAGIFIYLYFTKQPESLPSENNTQSSEATNEEVEITDTYVLRDLDEKIAILHRTSETGKTIDKGPVGGYYADLEMYNSGYLEPLAARVAHVIDSLESQFRYLTSEELESAIAESNIPDEYQTEVRNDLYKGIDGELVAAKYQDVFGEELKNEEPTRGCYYYHYNSTYDFYYADLIGGCGGSSPYSRYYFKSKYTSQGDKAYVYVSTALLNAEDNKVYCDVAALDSSLSSGIVEGSEVCATVAEGESFKLDGSNYSDFASYRFVFQKASDGTYYFEKVEKL